MNRRRIVLALAAVCAVSISASGRPEERDSASAIDRAFQKFWAAPTPSRANKIGDQIVATGIGFDEALRRVRIGRLYSPQRTGVIKMRHRTADGIIHYYAVKVPNGYDPKRRYQVRFQLHGGV